MQKIGSQQMMSRIFPNLVACDGHSGLLRVGADTEPCLFFCSPTAVQRHVELVDVLGIVTKTHCDVVGVVFLHVTHVTIAVEIKLDHNNVPRRKGYGQFLMTLWHSLEKRRF